MKNLIVSYEKLPAAVREALTRRYPHGFDHETFEFVNPKRREIYRALRFSNGSVNYLIKLEKREQNFDSLFDFE